MEAINSYLELIYVLPDSCYMGDLIGLSGPLQKLIEVVASGIGAFAGPYLKMRDADAEAYHRLLMMYVDDKKISRDDAKRDLGELSKAAKEAIVVWNSQDETRIDSGEEVRNPYTNSDINRTSLAERSQSRMILQASNRQSNIEQIAALAAEEVKQYASVSSEPVNQDWTSRFFRYVEDTSEEQMQLIWAKILAGEVRQPGSFSYRTLEALRLLSSEEAQIFASIKSQIVLDTGGGKMLVIAEYLKEVPSKKLLLLQESGIISTSPFTIEFEEDTLDFSSIVLEASNKILEIKPVVRPKPKNLPFQLEYYPPTRVGKDLHGLMDAPRAEETLHAIAFAARTAGLLAGLGIPITRDENGVAKTFDLTYQ